MARPADITIGSAAANALQVRKPAGIVAIAERTRAKSMLQTSIQARLADYGYSTADGTSIVMSSLPFSYIVDTVMAEFITVMVANKKSIGTSTR